MNRPWLLILTLSWISSGANSQLPNFKLQQAPKFIEEPISTTAFKGRPVTLYCRVDGYPSPTVVWSRNGEPVPLDGRRVLLPSGALVIRKVINNRRNKPDVGVYQCQATNRVGTTVSRKVKLSVAVLSKKFQEQPQNSTTLEGTTARFSCKTRKANPDPTFTWQKDGTPINTTNERFIILPRGVLHITGVKKSDAGRYRCVAQNTAKTRYSNYAVLTVQEVDHGKTIPLNFTVPPSNTTSIKGATAIMECVVTGIPLPVVTWRKLGGKHKLHGISNLRIKDVTERDNGQYECVATAGGKTIRRSAWLFVKEPPRFTSKPKRMIAEEEGLPVKLLCSASGSPQPKITWLKNGRVLHYKDHGSQISLSGEAKILNIQRTNVSDSGVYQCFAENDVGNIQVSSRVRVRRSGPVKLQPPTNLKITAESPNSLLVTWNKPDFPGKISYYYIKCESSRGEKHEPIVNSSTKYKLEKLQSNTQYVCKIQALSTTSVSSWSKSVKAKTKDGAPTGPPTGVAVKSETPDSMDVSWNPPSKRKHHGVITNYVIRYQRVRQSEDDLIDVLGNEHKATINNLNKGEVYTVEVAAETSGGLGPFSQKVFGTVLSIPNEVISAPLMDYSVLNSSAVKVMWRPPLYGANKVTHYHLLSVKNSQSNQQQTIKINKHLREYLFGKLDSNAVYIIKLQAWNGKEFGKTATIILRNLQVPDKNKAPALPPRNIHCKVGMPSTSLHITWEDTRKDIASYIVKYEIHGNKDSDKVETKDANFKFILLSGLTPGKKYSVSVQSRHNTQILPGKFSKAIICTTPEAAPSSPPLNVKFRFLTKTSVELRWMPPEQPNGKLTKYKILYSVNKTLDYNFWNTKTSLAASELFDSKKYEIYPLTELQRNVTYYVKIFAINNEGQGPPSNPIKIQVAQEQLVGKAVQNITVEVTRFQTADIYWSPVMESMNRIMKYVLFYCNDSKKPHEEWKSEMLDMDKSTFERKIALRHIQLQNLKPRETYYVKMRAEYSAAVGPWSKVVRFTVPDGSWPIPTRSRTTTTKTLSEAINKTVEPEKQTSSKEFAIKLGIIIGCVITIVFTIILALFVVWRNPCRYGYPREPKQDFELKDTKLPQNCYVPAAQMGFPHKITSQKGGGKDESSLNSSGPGQCHCHIVHKPAVWNLKPANFCNSKSQVPAVSQKEFSQNGYRHPASLPSHKRNRNGSISSQEHEDANKTFHPETSSLSDDAKVAIKTVVIERRVNSNSLSVDV